ncbi:MAG TPA: substrate-binding domain-containing protein, partial [Chthoniobacterales bacterium]
MKLTFLRNAPLVATLVASLSFGASLSSIAQPKDVTIGLAVANLQADFFNQIKQSVEAEAKAKGVTVITVDAKGDSATQVSQVQDLITRGVKALIYIPAGATAAGVPVKAAKAAGIPVICVDRTPPDAPGDTFIATDSVSAAKTLGEYVGKITS